MDNLSPATQATFDALTELGQGTVHEVREKSGKARSTTDKALKELAEAGLIVEVDTGADPGDAADIRWRLATPEPDAAPEGQTDTGPIGDTGIGADTGQPAGSEEAIRADTDDATPSSPTRPADRKVLIVAGVLGDYPDGTTIEVIADACGLGAATVIRLLTAMEQADAARRIPANTDAGTPELWSPGEGKASQVNPNPAPPQCPTCGQPIRPHRTAGTTPPGTRDAAPLNSDGSEPLARNVLRGWVLELINIHPDKVFTPQDIATELAARHNRAISSGAVRNNCTTLAAAGLIHLATNTPLTFTALPIPTTQPSDQ